MARHWTLCMKQLLHGVMHVLQVIPPGADACDDAGRPVETPRYAAGTPFQHRPVAAMHAAGEGPDAELFLVSAGHSLMRQRVPEIVACISKELCASVG